MNTVKNKFSIKDLENLTGVKAHTIRIWEKRYDLLQPKRTDTNIRYYNLESFQKLLNISYLNNNGYKISKISQFSDIKIQDLVKQLAQETNSESHVLNSFKVAMFNFDQALFYKTYNTLILEYNFAQIFYNVFIPLLTEMGLLWQTKTISPSHEHFITSLIRQKIILNTEKIQSSQVNDSKKTFVLYLPDNEIHELGLMFLNHQIVSHGYQSIFLGQSVPLESLIDLQNHYDEIIYLSYFTIAPDKENIANYITEFNRLLLRNHNSKFWVLGRMLAELDLEKLPEKVTPFTSIQSLIDTL